mmetsp:Transcript_242/g.364  ORF Transcript_242/g.364 Transcript_242/m.364 type:complete len:84 (-) Transcript_242:23-274(-)
MDSTKKPMDAKLHLKRLRENVLPAQLLSHTKKPTVITNGAARAARIPNNSDDMTLLLCFTLTSPLLAAIFVFQKKNDSMERVW